jgi:hypothetical protein
MYREFTAVVGSSSIPPVLIFMQIYLVVVSIELAKDLRFEIGNLRWEIETSSPTGIR